MTRCAAGLSSTGCVRKHNEDCAAVDGAIISEGAVSAFALGDGHHLLLVADGMGGHAKGEVASAFAVDALVHLTSSMTDAASCVHVVREVNRSLYDVMKQDETLRGMGTTIVGVVLQKARAIWFNVGDSRAYLYRGALQQLTTDHVPAGDTARKGRRSHAITQSLGGGFGVTDIWPAAGSLSLMPGDKLLICSDGLTDLLSDDEIAALLDQAIKPEETVTKLIKTALTRGAPDNVTVIVVSL